jgi:hypothetical protein
MSEGLMDCVESIPDEKCRKNSAAPALSETSFEKTRLLFDVACSEIATYYNLVDLNGKPRKAQIIEIIARNTCTSCIDKRLREKPTNNIDNFYVQCHLLACNILVEELWTRLTEKGYSVLITNEKRLEYGKIDVLIIPSRHGVDLYLNKKEIGIEVKTGNSLSFSQLFRYMLDNVDRTLILWRIRNKQILIFEGTKLKPLLMQFMKMTVSRAERLLSNQKMLCEHALKYKSWSPSQQQLQEAFSDFSDGVVETLPSIIETVVMMLHGEQINNVENKSKISMS